MTGWIPSIKTQGGLPAAGALAAAWRADRVSVRRDEPRVADRASEWVGLATADGRVRIRQPGEPDEVETEFCGRWAGLQGGHAGRTVRV